MSEKRFIFATNEKWFLFDNETEDFMDMEDCKDKLNEQQELIEELHSSDNMGWRRAEKFEKELKQKKIYIKRLEYKVQKFKEMNSEQQATITALKEENEQLRQTIRLYEEQFVNVPKDCKVEVGENVKRFEVINARWQGKGESVAFEDIQTNQVYFAENKEECERIVDLLNELYEENEQLRQELEQLKKVK